MRKNCKTGMYEALCEDCGEKIQSDDWAIWEHKVPTEECDTAWYSVTYEDWDKATSIAEIGGFNSVEQL